MSEVFITAADITDYSSQVNGTLVATMAGRACGIVNDAVRNQWHDPLFAFADDWSNVAPSTRIRAGTYSPALALPLHEVGSVTSVLNSAGATVSASTYTQPYDGRLRFTGGLWDTTTPVWAGEYTITAKWGALAPQSIKEIAIELAINIWRSKERGSFTDQLGVSGGGQFALIGRLDALQLQTIRNYVEQHYWMARYE